MMRVAWITPGHSVIGRSRYYPAALQEIEPVLSLLADHYGYIG